MVFDRRSSKALRKDDEPVRLHLECRELLRNFLSLICRCLPGKNSLDVRADPLPAPALRQCAHDERLRFYIRDRSPIGASAFGAGMLPPVLVVDLEELQRRIERQSSRLVPAAAAAINGIPNG